MFVHPNVGGKPSLQHNVRAGPDGAIGIELVFAVGFVVVLTLAAVQTSPGLGADADTLTLLDLGDLGADPDCLANDLLISERLDERGNRLYWGRAAMPSRSTNL